MLFTGKEEKRENEGVVWKAVVACTMLVSGCACTILALLCAKGLMKSR